MADRRPPGGTGSDVNPYEANDIHRAVDLVEQRMRMLMNVRETLLSHQDTSTSDDGDHRMARSMATAVINDGPLITQYVQEERVARHDRHLTTGIDVIQEEMEAQNVNPIEVDRRVQDFVDRNPAPAPIEPDAEEMSYLAKLAGRYVSHGAGEALMPNNVLAAEFAASGEQALRHIHTCGACTDDKIWFDIFVAPCGDKFCGACLQILFQTSLKDESLFPPSCCQQVMSVDSRELKLFLNENILSAYGPRKIELETTNRTYCHACTKFILPESINGRLASCPECGQTTCADCKAAAHDAACEPDEAAQAVLELAKTEQWQRCYKCLNLVELSIGCNHMTCRCNAEFCYVCAEVWKKCSCELFDEGRLLERAQQVVDRDGPRRNEAPEQREERVQQMVDVIRERHECHHGTWRCVYGSYECENCHQHLPNFILECENCLLRACVRCRRHRRL